MLSCAGAWCFGSLARSVISRRSKLETPELPPTISAGLTIDRKSLDLEAVWETKQHICRLPIRNLTGRAVEVLEIAVGCNCTSVKPQRLSVPTGGVAEIELKIDLTHRLPHETDLAERAFYVEIVPALRSGHRQKWGVHGNVKSRLALSSDFLQFADSPVHGQRAVKRVVSVKTHVPTQDLKVEWNADVTRIEIQRKGQNEFDLAVAVNPKLPAGKFRDVIALDVIDPSGKRLPGAVLPVEGVMQPEVRLLPSRVFIGTHPVGTIASATVLMQIPDDITARVDHIESDSPDITVEDAAIEGVPPGRAFRVTEIIRNSGDRSSRLQFFINKGKSPPEVLTVEVVCRGEPKNEAIRPNGGGR